MGQREPVSPQSKDPTETDLTSIEACEQVLDWIDKAQEHGVAIRVLQAETGHGKTYVAQSLYDQLVRRSTNFSAESYWQPGLAPKWPPINPTKLESNRKRVIPGADLRKAEPGRALKFGWIGLPLGEVAGTGNLDPSNQFFEQLDALVNDVTIINAERIQDEQKRKAVSKTGLMFAPRAVRGVIEGVVEAITTEGHSALQSGSKLFRLWKDALSDPSTLKVAEARKATLDAFLHLRKYSLDHESEGGLNDPLVIVLDDAHEADSKIFDLIKLITGLRSPAPDVDEYLSDESGYVEADVDKDWQTPNHRIPILILATTWPDESTLRSGGVFEKWLAMTTESLSGLAGAVEIINLRPIARMNANNLLVESGVSKDDADSLVQHFSVPYEQEFLNFLVLSHGRAEIESRLKDPFHRPLSKNEITRLPTAPTFHTQERLEELGKVGTDGATARALLEVISPWGRRIPLAVIDAINEDHQWRVEELLELMMRHRMINVWRDPSLAYPYLRIQTDIQAFLTDNSRDDTELPKVAQKVRWRVLEMSLNYRNDPDQLIEAIDRCVQLDPKLDYTLPLDCLTFAALTTTPRVKRRETRLKILDIARETGRGVLSERAAVMRANMTHNKDEKLEILEPWARDFPMSAVMFSRLHNNVATKLNVLSPWSRNHPLAATEYSKHVPPQKRVGLVRTMG